MSMELGAYAAFIWPAYGISALLLGGFTVWTIARWRAARAKLAALEKT
jgi:heme exporter protein CcmD